MSRYSKWAEKEHSETARLTALLPAGILFLILVPYTLLVVSPSLDTRLGLDLLSPSPASLIVGAILLVAGLSSPSGQSLLSSPRPGDSLADHAYPEAHYHWPIPVLSQPNDPRDDRCLSRSRCCGSNSLWCHTCDCFRRSPACLPQGNGGEGTDREIRGRVSCVQARRPIHHPQKTEKGLISRFLCCLTTR